MQPTDNKRNITILFFTMIVVMLGFGMIIPILPFYIEQFGASGKGLGALMATSRSCSSFSPRSGRAVDRYGRKPILMIGVLGNVLAQVLMGLSTQLWMLFVAAGALAGILSSATLPTAMAYISDGTGTINAAAAWASSAPRKASGWCWRAWHWRLAGCPIAATALFRGCGLLRADPGSHRSFLP